MICHACKRAADLNRLKLHKSCQGCDCAHRPIKEGQVIHDASKKKQ